MANYIQDSSDAQPIKASVKRILMQIIINAREPETQKAMIMTCYESDLFSIPETFALVHTLGIKDA